MYFTWSTGGHFLSQEIEIEFKNLLIKKEFEHLLTHLPFPKEGQKQTNHYFETNDFSLRKSGSALRIREKNNSYTLTLKQPYSTGILETHATLTKKEALNWISGQIIKKEQIDKQLKKLNININKMEYYGSLTTTRHETKYKDVLIVLDYSIYNGQSDYEFELEASNEKTGLEIFNNILNDHQIEKKTTPNKIHRFFTSLDNK